MNNETMALIAELEQRVSELTNALELVTASRDTQIAQTEALIKLYDNAKTQLTAQNAVIDRLRLHIQQGIEL